ncbi:MAG TPA: hypothetical protein VL984_11630, partial [Acidimicrobiales bacterium]|nr:hypothetical protein [Acidimicrobiales bacterium]
MPDQPQTVALPQSSTGPGPAGAPGRLAAARQPLPSPRPLASVGAPPPEAWVFAFVKGARAALAGTHTEGSANPSDVAWAEM